MNCLLKLHKDSPAFKSFASIIPLNLEGNLWSGVQMILSPLSKVNLITSAFFLVIPAQVILPGIISPLLGLIEYDHNFFPFSNSFIISLSSRFLPSNKSIFVFNAKHAPGRVSILEDLSPLTGIQ